jgi:septal ring factor EnvC (AmiA/AmiB activator)
MKTMDILEGMVKEALLRKTELETERKSLEEEVHRLRENIRVIENERQEIKLRLEQIIEKLEVYLVRSEA